MSAICIQSMGNFENIWKKSLPVAVAVLLFGAVALVGFAPQLEGKVLPQHDIQQFDCSSQDIRDCREKFDEDPQWTGAMFSGMPAYQINIKYPSQIIKRSAESVQSIFEGPASMIFFAMLSAFVMAIMMGMSAWIGIIIGLAYGLSTYFFIIIGAGHITKMWALVYAPAMLGAIHYTLRRNMWVGGALAALFAALEIGANHLQMTYYFLFAAAALFISELVYAIKEARYTDFGKRTAILGVAAILAIGANFAPIYYTKQHTDDTTRGGSAIATENQNQKGLDIKYATDWSYGIGESWNMLIPNLMGGDSGGNNTFAENGAVAKKFEELGVSKEESKEYAQSLPTYWGEQPGTAGPTYLGAIVIFLALLGLLLAENRDRWWILAATILSLFMAWGHNAMWFTEFCFKNVPLYDKFRSVSSALVVAEWSIPLLAGMALWQIHKHWEEKKQLSKAILISGGIVGGICLIFALGGMFIHDTWLCDFGVERSIENMGSIFGDEAVGCDLGEAMAAEQRGMLVADAWRSLIFILLGAGLLYGALYISRKWTLAILGGLAVLIVVDILPINLRYVPYKKFVSPDSVENEIQPNAADRAIMKDREPGYRVLDVTSGSPFNDATASKFHRSIGGYHGAKMSRYQDLIDVYLNREVATVKSAAGEKKEPDMQTLPILNMLNTKYIITRNGIVYNDYSRNGAAWFVDNLVGADDAMQELAALGEVDLKTTAVVASGTTVPQNMGKGSIQLMSYRPNNLRYNYTLTGGPGVAVFSEIYYDKGWQAYVDGQPAESFRADYLLRAMVLPEGTHTVEWRFEAPNWSSTSAVTLICSLLIILALITIVTLKCYGIYKKKEII